MTGRQDRMLLSGPLESATLLTVLPVPRRELPPSLRGVGHISRAAAAFSRLLPIGLPRVIFMRAEGEAQAQM